MRGRVRLLIVLGWVVATVLAATSTGFGVETRRLLVPLFTDLGFAWQPAHDLHNLVRKGLHVLAYAGFATVTWFALPRSGRRATLVIVAVAVLAVLDEAVQSLQPTRTARMADVLLDVLSGGVVVALLASVQARRRAGGVEVG